MPTVFFFPGMFLPYIEEGSIKIPENVDYFDANEYPHWRVFLNVHIGRPMYTSQFTKNAKIIGAIPDDKIKLVTIKDLEELGCDFTTSNYIV